MRIADAHSDEIHARSNLFNEGSVDKCVARFLVVADSVLNIERVAQRVVQLGTFSKAEMADPAAGEHADRQCHDVVARDHTYFGESFFRSNFDLRANPANCSRNRSAGQRRENLNGSVSCQHAHRTPASGASQIGPDDVAPGYQFEIVSVASRAATSTMIGSCGVKRYDACSSASARRSSSASSTATAPLRRSSERLVPRSAASRSSRATRSSSNCTRTSRRPMNHMVTHMNLVIASACYPRCQSR
jgi:hypothetical protein